MTDSLQPHGLYPTSLLCLWDFPGKNTGVGCHFLLHGNIPIQGSNSGLPHYRQTLYHLSHQGSPSGKKAMTNLDNVLKSRDITLPTKVCIIKAVVFPVAMYRCESWTIKKAEHQRTDAFELWCWRRLLRVPQTARRSNQSVLKEFNPEYSLERLMLKLKLQYFGHLMQRANSLEKTLCWERLKAGEGDNRE